MTCGGRKLAVHAVVVRQRHRRASAARPSCFRGRRLAADHRLLLRMLGDRAGWFRSTRRCPEQSAQRPPHPPQNLLHDLPHFTDTATPDEVPTMKKTHPLIICTQWCGIWSAPIVLCGCLMLGCAGSKLLDQARHGQHRALRAELLRHPPSNRAARQLAQETLSYEVSHAQDRIDRAFIRSLATC